MCLFLSIVLETWWVYSIWKHVFFLSGNFSWFSILYFLLFLFYFWHLFFFFKMLALLTSLTFCKMLVLGSPCFILFFLFLISISEICFSFCNSFSNFSPKIFIKFFYLNYHVPISNIKKKKSVLISRIQNLLSSRILIMYTKFYFCA